MAAPDEIAVVEIDPEVADTAAMSEAYDLPMTTGANCVVVAGKRDGEERVAACLVRADTRADVNNPSSGPSTSARRRSSPWTARSSESGMEYGGITPVGLPAAWRVLVDPRVLDIDVAVIGSGRPPVQAARAGPPARRAARRRGRRGPGGYLMPMVDDDVTADDGRDDDGRDETEAERADRKWDDMLQELRVMQTGAQLTAGFLLTLPFQQRFEDLTRAAARRLPGAGACWPR